ncbi:MAG: MlaD family protein [Verrucomicrobia bacterium]|nr:MlaD family protein [Verrucomicrobiota bacterium]
MALNDLTPQLRTRLSRVERAVGWFVFLAAALLVFGFAYYIYHRASVKGWFTPKFKYQTCLNNAAGLKLGDPVKLMGFTAGEITEIIPNAPDAYYGVTVNFVILKPHYGYIWDDSAVKVGSDLLGNRFLEITKGAAGIATIDEGTNQTPRARLRWDAVRSLRKNILVETRTAHPGLEQSDPAKFNWFFTDSFKRRVETERQTIYTNLAEIYWVPPLETAALNERLERVATQIEQAMPNILNLTNKIAAVLDNSARLTSNLNVVAVSVQPVIANVADLTAQLRGPGALGQWVLSTNMNQHLEAALARVDSALTTVDTNLPATLESINRALENLAGITANLRVQVEANTNLVTHVSKTIVDTDDMVQGLKRHWLLRSAFKTPKTNAPAAAPRK